MTIRKLNRCRRALERFTVNAFSAAKDDGYAKRKAVELASLEKTCRSVA